MIYKKYLTYRLRYHTCEPTGIVAFFTYVCPFLIIKIVSESITILFLKDWHKKCQRRKNGQSMPELYLLFIMRKRMYFVLVINDITGDVLYFPYQ